MHASYAPNHFRQSHSSGAQVSIQETANICPSKYQDVIFQNDWGTVFDKCGCWTGESSVRVLAWESSYLSGSLRASQCLLPSLLTYPWARLVGSSHLYELENSHLDENIFRSCFCFSLRKANNEERREIERERGRDCSNHFMFICTLVNKPGYETCRFKPLVSVC